MQKDIDDKLLNCHKKRKKSHAMPLNSYFRNGSYRVQVMDMLPVLTHQEVNHNVTIK